ncbi:MAG TPA: SDR family oxidoreductase [Acidimicrobiales bacterium]|nr:SDR family oxidoreductase [Acidimicrobiales bacterium]
MPDPTQFSSRAGAAVVLGGTGGIGAATVRLLRQRGSVVAFTFRSNEQLARSIEAEDASARTRAWRLELDDAEAAARLVDEAAAWAGGIHTVVYASGPHVPMTHLSRVSPDVLRRQVDEDAGGFFNVVQPALAHLRRSRGAIVAVTTAATGRFAVRDGLSVAPKAAIEALVRGIAAEEGRFGVRANCVGPGMLSEGMAARLIANGDLDERALEVARANTPLRRFGTALDVAEAVCFLASDAAGFVTGQKLSVDGGYSA